MSRVGSLIWLVVCLAAVGGGIALLAYAESVAPSGEHHGQALDGLDGIGSFFALLAGAGGLLLVVLGGWGLVRRR